MPAFFLSMLATLLLTCGARDQMLMAQVAHRFNQPFTLLISGWLASLLAAAVATFGGVLIAPLLTPAAKQILLAMTLLVAALEMVWMRSSAKPTEPTRSMFAIVTVILARQITDGARFVLFGLAAYNANMWLVLIGGAFGGAAALTVAWSSSDTYQNMLPWKPIRWAMAATIAGVAVYLGLSGRGLL